MPEILTSDQMRALEAAAFESGRVASLDLMELAGQAVADAILDAWPDLEPKARAVVFCGPGNNGGDGYVVARLLRGLGWRVHVFAYDGGQTLPKDAETNRGRWIETCPGETTGLGFPHLSTEDVQAVRDVLLSDAGPVVAVDALFGIGLTRALVGLEPVFALIADTHKASDLRCVSVDVPSGLTDAGPVTDRPSGVFQADLTVTFHALKAAHRSGAAFCGRIIVKDIGL